MSSEIPTGFKSFPVSKGLILATIALPLLASLTTTKYIYYYAYVPFLSDFHQPWRLLTFQLAYVNESEVFLGMIMLYLFRNLERLYSSHKYLSIVVVLYLYTLLSICLLTVFKFYTGMTWLNGVPSGPTSILFALLAQYRDYIPVMYKFEIHGPNDHKIVLTDQFFVFLIGFQLSITQGVSSIAMALLGWTIGDLVSRSVLPGKGWRLPFWKQLTQKATPPRLREDTPVLATTRQEEEEEEAATETRPLASQFLDTFRR